MPYVRYDRQSFIGIAKSGVDKGDLILTPTPTKAQQFTDDQIEMLTLVLRFIGETQFLIISDEIMDKMIERYEAGEKATAFRELDLASSYN